MGENSERKDPICSGQLETLNNYLSKNGKITCKAAEELVDDEEPEFPASA